MKRIYLFVIALLLSLGIQAQSNRMLLAEGFTSTTCGPCAAQNPTFDALLKANTDKITSIKYHMSWPSPGNDPMYLHNTVDNNSRRTYYNINSVPHVYLSGNIMHGVPGNITQATINNNSGQPAAFDIVMNHRLNAAEDSIFVTMLIKANQAMSGNLVAHIAVIEKEIHFTSAPGTNGEKDFYNVMKALLPSRSGTALDAFGAGDYTIIETGWKLANVYNKIHLAAVGFVQNNTTKEVYQAANSTDDAIVPFYVNDAEVLRLENTTSNNCSGTMAPKMVLVNNGSAPLTSAKVDFSVNGEVLQTINWTGNLSFREKATIDAGMINFGVLANNMLNITITEVNNTSDDFNANNSFDYAFVQSPNLSGTVNVYLMLDNKPEETTWELRTMAGDVIQSGGPYTQPASIVLEPLIFPSVGCYEFIIYDAGGNGLCCSNGVGYFAIIEGSSTNPVFSGQAFGYLERNEITYGFVGVEENTASSTLSIQPNPASEAFTAQLTLSETSPVKLMILDLAGRTLLTHDYGVLETGTHALRQSLLNIPKGAYIVVIRSNGTTSTSRLLVK